jgi:hypothetical protein
VENAAWTEASRETRVRLARQLNDPGLILNKWLIDLCGPAGELVAVAAHDWASEPSGPG